MFNCDFVIPKWPCCEKVEKCEFTARYFLKHKLFLFPCVYNDTSKVVYHYTANASKYYGSLISYCNKAWDVHLDCVMKVGVSSVVM